MEGEACMAYQPFYIANMQNQEENWEALEEKDWDYIKGMYPQMAKEIQEKVEEACDKLEYDGSMMFDEYPDKLMMRNICDRIYKEMQEKKGEEGFYAEDDRETADSDTTVEGMTVNNEIIEQMPIDGCTSCQRYSLQSSGWNFPQGGPEFPPPRPPQGGPGFPPPRPPQGGPGFPPPRPPQGGPGFPPPRPPQGGPGFPPPRPPQGGSGFPPPRPPQGPGFFPPRPPKRPCSCPPGRPCRDCLVALQNQPDWMRDMIEVLLYQEMLHRRSRRRRRRQYQRNYGLTE